MEVIYTAEQHILYVEVKGGADWHALPGHVSTAMGAKWDGPLTCSCENKVLGHKAAFEKYLN